MRALDAFFSTTPFRVPLDAPVADLAAGQKQKGEILRQLYLKRNLLILDEPTSVLTPDEADEVLSTLKKLTERQEDHHRHHHAQVPRGECLSATR